MAEKPIILNNSPDTTAKIDLIENEENPTHFIELNNSHYESNIKIIKVKIIVPKGTLTNSKFDHKSNVLTVMNDIDKITFNVRTTTENSSEVLKITNILNSDEHSNESMKLEECCKLSKPKYSYPIMGTNALLVKTNSIKNTEVKNEEQLLSDSAIIDELVNERYQDSMIELYQRNFRRQTSRRSSLQSNSRTISENSADKDINYNFENNIKHSSTMLNELEENIDDLKSFGTFQPSNLEYCHISNTTEVLDNAKIVDPRQYLYSTETVFSTSSSDNSTNKKNTTFNSSDFNVDVTLGSAIDFILSTNGNQIDTSTSINDYESSVSTSNITPQSKSDFDEDKFLQRALGEELNDYISTDSKEMDQTGTTDTNYTSYVSSTSKSVNSSDVSLLLSKASSLYSTVSSKIRHLGKGIPLHFSEGTISEEAIEDGSSNTSDGIQISERIAVLTQESVVQLQVMQQTAKALGYCRSVKEFVGSFEQIEAERMLLLATCKHQAIVDIIRKYEFSDHNEEDHQNQNQNSRGTITISNFNFHPEERNSPKIKKSTSNKKNVEHSDLLNQWFVCIINCNEFTYATEAKMATKDGFVRFEDEVFRFEDLGMDFELKVSLYAIKLKNSLRNYSHESKYHLNKDLKTNSILCPPTPSASFLQHLTLTRSPPSTNNPPSIKHSFIPFGTSILRVNSFKASNHYRLNKMPTISSNQLSGVFSADVKTELVVRSKGSGFMTIGQGDNVTTWSRHWCELEGSKLSWWNYPQQGNGVERADALGCIDIRTCISARVISVDRNICARPRTLLLETTNNKDGKITRHLLSFDSAQEMGHWENKLNRLLDILRSWNAMQTTNRM